jgi:hypothetical protein
MATSGENWVWIVSGLFCLSSIAVLQVFLFEARDWRNVPAFAWAILYVFLGFKQAFVKQDDFHFWFGMLEAIFPGTLVVLAATGALSLPTTRRHAPVFRSRLLVPARQLRWFSAVFS